ncbi:MULTISPECIES: hypothetical protein [unclassified Shewanella]|uniref:hypothetical protein n=1 Tax=unclassified Shewanella TaxID=196818 RepID=UPI001BBFF9AA|nr:MULTISPECIES: hypothetical protein [unclassified Shewanella]GIU19970.1 hypothetical protein TUM4444_37020 [Shewanella sp. MBTL60-112-B1]GIU34432.1 hypothetical protein TUM4445_23050 [Shewanella sp. MBTL60-112-B2]
MAHLPWVMAPSMWIRGKGLKYFFSGGKEVSTDIAALKIFIFMCMKAERKKTAVPTSHALYGIKSVIECLEINVTYEEISEACNLSRTLISRGLKKLVVAADLKRAGGTRKVIYVVDALHWGWFKLPCKPILSLEDHITSFHNITNRKRIERDALKLYLYLLSIRTNSKETSAVSNSTISESTGISIIDIDDIEMLLIRLELVERIEKKGVKKNASKPYTVDDLTKEYSFNGSIYLNKVAKYYRSDDYEDKSI